MPLITYTRDAIYVLSPHSGYREYKTYSSFYDATYAGGINCIQANSSINNDYTHYATR